MLNLHIYPTDFQRESRMFKVVHSLEKLSAISRIDMVGIGRSGLKEREPVNEKISLWRVPLDWKDRYPIPMLRSLLHEWEWHFKIKRAYRGQKIDIIHSNSITDLPVAVALKKMNPGSRLVYDAHELETETAWLQGMKKKMAKKTERKLISEVDHLVVVSDSIADWYRKEYPVLKEVSVIRNIPWREPKPPVRAGLLRKNIGLDEKDVLIIYQGNLSAARGVELLLEVFQELPEKDKHLVLLGFGPLEETVKAIAARVPNIHFHPAVPNDQIMAWSCDADAGIHLIENTCLNHYYCLPNKVFEYIQSGIPLIVRDYPDMGGLVQQYGCGWTISEHKNEIVNLIASLSKEDILEKKEKALLAREHLGWQEEEQKLLKVYQKLLMG